MTPIEIIALVFAVGVLTKMVFLTVRPKKFLKLTKPMLKHTTELRVVYVIFAVILGWYIFQVYTIVDVAAITMFAALLMGISWLPYSKALTALCDEFVKKEMVWKNMLAIVIWVGLALWVLYFMFG